MFRKKKKNLSENRLKCQACKNGMSTASTLCPQCGSYNEWVSEVIQKQYASDSVVKMAISKAMTPYEESWAKWTQTTKDPVVKCQRVAEMAECNALLSSNTMYTNNPKGSGLPHLPVLPDYSQLLYTALVAGLHDVRLIDFPSSLTSGTFYWVYGFHNTLIATLDDTYTNEAAFYESLNQNLHQLICFKIHEWNPHVSLSYIWGNVQYPESITGLLRHNVAPVSSEYEQGKQDIDDTKVQIYPLPKAAPYPQPGGRRPSNKGRT